ncbi:cell wall assembly protein [Pedobacter sp. HMWF019]|uniref:SMI1/KNR4 family protein n=1 Tax=Pedobacter sp. HMWF019 TaxID=2056856 RepID=UPI000D3A1ABF|nr:SMI1/KNR4 family protein [Pedobacter sp. HMWF019]PTS99127.1 cell wall assembly protein [Pedobacter sp. HMWF019]
MAKIERNPPVDADAMDTFLKAADFALPNDFLDFFKKSDGAEIRTEDHYVLLWPIPEIIQLNEDYGVEEYAPGFFLFGSDGGGTAYAIEKATGFIFELPFIAMSKDEAIFKSKNFTDFIGLD